MWYHPFLNGDACLKESFGLNAITPLPRSGINKLSSFTCGGVACSIIANPTYSWVFGEPFVCGRADEKG